MKIVILHLMFSCLFLSSCATLLNKPYKTVIVSSNTPTKIIYQKDTLFIEDEIKLKFIRSKNPVSIYCISDTSKNEYKINSTFSSTLLLNFLTYGVIGFIPDAFSKKRFSYPSYVNISPKESTNNFTTIRPTYTGDVYFNVSLPLFNWIGNNNTTNTLQNTFQPGGIGLSVDYYHTNKSFFNFSLNSIYDIFYLYEFQANRKFNSVVINRLNYFGVSNNHHFNKVFVGYGLSFGESMIDPIDSISSTYPYTTHFSKNIISYSAGLLFSTYCQAGKYMNLGIIYKPSFHTINNYNPISYQYYIGLDIRYRFRIKKGKNTQKSKFRDNFNNILFPK